MILIHPAYPTYQVFVAFAVSAALCALVMPLFIRLMQHNNVGQQIRADGPEQHLVKQGTPTMGGIVMLLAMLITTILFAPLTTPLIVLLVATYATALLGLSDDIASVAHGRSLGLTASQKMAGLITISVSFCLVATNLCNISPHVAFPGGFYIDLGVLTTQIAVGGISFSIPWLYVLFVFLLLAGMSNAVNLTDGLDGLSSGTVMVVMGVMAMVAFRYEQMSLAVFSSAAAGACLGFLWHNCHPASIFMGDTGSLALGAAFAALAVLTNTEITSLIMGGLFIVEALSVMIQVASFKMTGKRVFLMAPIHHHFERLGWSETKVVVRFWIVSAAFAAIGFALFFQLGTL